IASSAATSAARLDDHGLPRMCMTFIAVTRASAQILSQRFVFFVNTRGNSRTLSSNERSVGSMPGGKRANVKNEKQYEALKDKGMSKERAAKIANSPGSSSRGGKKSHSSSSRSSSSQGGTTAQKKAAGRKGGKAAARKS